MKTSSMNRRAFIGALAASAAAARTASSQSSAAALHIEAVAQGAEVPRDFAGLSYESAQLANPEFFASSNRALIQIFRELSPAGNLRLGGGSSEFTTFQETASREPAPFEVFGPDTSKTVKTGTITTGAAIRNLRGFLDAVNWNCLYGLNLGQGTIENAVSEAATVQAILGPRLQAFQIGNEPDSFRNRYRPATYSPEEYIVEWNRFQDAIARAVPGAKFAGPDISNKLAYLTAFAANARKHSDVVLLTSHYYAMGPAGNPAATLDNLLEPEPKLTTLKDRDLHIIAEAREEAHLPYRMSEGNSCWNGGQPGVSDTFASALWCADDMLTCMGRGWSGVNLHGGGNGVYAPIAGAPSSGFTRRPEFFGMRFAVRFQGARCVPCRLIGSSARVSAYVFERDGERELALVNKTPDPIACALPADVTGEPVLMLSAPSVDAKTGVQLAPAKGSRRGVVAAPGYTAGVFALKHTAAPGKESL